MKREGDSLFLGIVVGDVVGKVDVGKVVGEVDVGEVVGEVEVVHWKGLTKGLVGELCWGIFSWKLPLNCHFSSLNSH